MTAQKLFLAAADEERVLKFKQGFDMLLFWNDEDGGDGSFEVFFRICC